LGFVPARFGNQLGVTGYDVVASDDRRIGSVVEVRGEYLIVEQGRLRKTRRALPKAFAHPVDAERIVRVTVSRELISDSPKVGSDWDERAVARHYGLAGGYAHPETEGEGVILHDDPAESASVDGQRHGVKPGRPGTRRDPRGPARQDDAARERAQPECGRSVRPDR
jgi:hypothetical protein